MSDQSVSGTHTTDMQFEGSPDDVSISDMVILNTAQHPVNISNENMLLRTGEHNQMANAQRCLYQNLEFKAITDSRNKVSHHTKMYILVVD